MKLITRDTDYAIRALACMAVHTKEVLDVPDLMEYLKIPRPFLRKILQTLTRKGILRSYKGIGGGFELRKPPSSIYLVDVMKIFQGPVSLNECFFKKKICPGRSTCPLKRKIDKIERYVVSELGAIAISDLI